MNHARQPQQKVGTVVIILAVFALVAAQLMFKSRFNVLGEVPWASEHTMDYVRLLLSDPGFIFGIVLMGVSSILWYLGLSRVPLSVATPLAALSYPLILVLSLLVLQEPLGVMKILGNGLIFAGVLLVVARR